MKTAIIYSSRHGTTEKIARLIANKLPEVDITIIDLRTIPEPSIDEFDRIIIGGSIHMGKIQTRIKKFIDQNIEILFQKQIGLFICGMNEDKLQEEFELAYQKRLRDHSVANGIFGGELLFERMNLLEKFIVKTVAHQHKSVSKIDFPAIDDFIAKLKAAKKDLRLNKETADEIQ